MLGSTGSINLPYGSTMVNFGQLMMMPEWLSYALALGEMADEEFKRIGTNVVDAGSALGKGLLPVAASALGLVPGTAVAAGLIDGHAGGIGTVGARSHDSDGNTSDDSATTRMACVFGTSACTMTSTIEPAFVPGVWGPYFSAMVPGLWLSEAGQSAAGAAIDHLVSCHPAATAAKEIAERGGVGLTSWLA